MQNSQSVQGRPTEITLMVGDWFAKKEIQPHSALTMRDDGEEEGLGARDQEVECFACNEIGLWLG